MILSSDGVAAFIKIAETGTVHAAASVLGLTQTAVTQRLKGLETTLKLTLFLRSRRGMALTPDGEALLQYCRSVDELEGLFFSRVSKAGQVEWSVVLVGPTSAVSTRVAPQCAPLYKTHSQLRLHLRADDHSDRVTMVKRGEADLAIVPPELVPNEMTSKVLKPDRYLLVASAEWRGRRLQDILETERIIDFYEQDQTTLRYLRAFDLAKPTRARLFVNENEALIRMFEAGAGFGTLTESVARPALDSGRLITLNRGQAMEDPLALIWYPRPQMPELLKAVIKAIV